MSSTTTTSTASSAPAPEESTARPTGPTREPRRTAPPPRPERPVVLSGWKETAAVWVSRVVLLGAIWSLLGLVLRPVQGARRVDDLFGLVNLPASPSLFSAVLLLVLAGAVRRRMWAAWFALVVFQALAAVYVAAVLARILERGEDTRNLSTSEVVELGLNIGFTVALVWLLWRIRGAFSSRLLPGRRSSAAAVLGLGLGFSVSTSVALTLVFPATLADTRHKFAWAIRTAIGLEPTQSDIGWTGQHGHHWVAFLAGLLSALSLIAATYVFLRSARAKSYLTASDELDLRGLLDRHGRRDSLGYFATRHDKSVVFSPDRNAAVTYRVLDGVSLASADPIGAPSAWPAAVEAWLTEARTFGWFPAVLSASGEGARAYVDAGLRALPLGDEAIIEVGEFTLSGPTMEPIRRAVRRVSRAGYSITVARHADLSPEQLAEMQERAEQWRGEAPERGFSMALGRLGDPADGQCVAVLAFDADGVLRGLLSMVPWGNRGLSLDLMRRDRASENGVIEAMVAELVRVARDDLLVQQISLNFAMFRGIFGAAERVGARPLVRLASKALTFASRFWQIESLYRSNARYLPRWEPRYLCYDSPLTLARISLAAGRAEGFLPAFVRAPERAPDEQVVWGGREMPLAEAAALQREAAGRLQLPTRRLQEQQRVRMAKLEHLRAAGMEPYPVAVPRDTTIAEVVGRHVGLGPAARTGHVVSVVGRVHAVRTFGGVVFLVLRDGGAAVQALLERDVLGEQAHALLRSGVDLGDHVSVTGEVVTSDKGELSVRAESWQLAAKCLQPLPDLRRGLTDPDALVRRRHLDMIVNPGVTDLLVKRSVAIREVRQAFARREYLEVETPMLQSVHGGANARPFLTHINAYDMSLYLRIAPELYLKRLCVGGMPKIFELNRNFRNEGADATHNPEFTSVEAYEAHSDYLGMRDLTRELILEVATAVHGRPIAWRPGPGADEALVAHDLSGPWRSVTVHDAVSAALDHPIDADTSHAELTALCRDIGLPFRGETAGAVVVDLYERLVEKTTLEPTFYLDFPIETSPLTRRHRSDARLAERWDLVAFGMEIGTAYSELIDPVEQRTRLSEQSLAAAAGDPEAMEIDEAFLDALEYAMPPTGGLGVGVDRLVMLLTGASIRQTLAFPFVRPGGR